MLKTLSNALSRGMIVAASGWLLSACAAGDTSPTAPLLDPTASAAVSASGAPKDRATVSSVNALGRRVPLGRAVTTSAAIGPAGGTLTLPSAGLRLVVPPGAVSSLVTFRVTALPGDAIAYEFAPHGITFHVPLQLQQGLSQTTWLPGLTMRGGYFKDPKQVDTRTRKAQVDELFPALRVGGNAILEIRHFSGYLIAMG